MARRLAFDALTLVDERGLRVREAVAAAEAGRRFDGRDRLLGNELALGVVRREGTLDAILARRLKRPIDRQDPRVLRVLRIGAYQVLFLDRVPRSAAVDTAVDLVRQAGQSGAAGMVNAVLRAVCDLASDRPAAPAAAAEQPRRSVPRGDGTWTLLAEDVFPDPTDDLAGNLADRYGVPRAAVARFLADHGDAGARQILDASVARPPVSVRPRAGRTADVEAALAAAGIECEREGPCLLVRGGGNVKKLPLWDEGAFVIQDATAAEAPEALGDVSGARILDVCAAPGGKTIVLAERAGAAGHVVAVDLPGPRVLQMLTDFARRGAGNVEVVPADATDAAQLPPGPFGAVFVDAPCSNSGVLAKRVEARRRLADDGARASLAEIQARLLDAASTRVAGGRPLAWSTCSVDSDENGARVRAFLAAHPDFRLVSERTTLPVAGRRDGGYVAVLVRGSG